METYRELFGDEGTSPWQQLEDGVIPCTKRFKGIVGHLNTHPDDDEGLVEAGYCKSTETARRQIKRACKTTKIGLINRRMKANGAYKNVYGTYATPYIEHEYSLTRFFDPYPYWVVERGHKLERNADAVIWSEDEQTKAYVELHTGSMPLERMKKRLESYEACDGYVIFVCRSANHIEKLQTILQPLKEVALLGVLDEIRKQPYEPIYQTANGVGVGIGELMGDPRTNLHP